MTTGLYAMVSRLLEASARQRRRTSQQHIQNGTPSRAYPFQAGPLVGCWRLQATVRTLAMAAHCPHHGLARRRQATARIVQLHLASLPRLSQGRQVHRPCPVDRFLFTGHYEHLAALLVGRLLNQDLLPPPFHLRHRHMLRAQTPLRLPLHLPPFECLQHRLVHRQRRLSRYQRHLGRHLQVLVYNQTVVLHRQQPRRRCRRQHQAKLVLALQWFDARFTMAWMAF